jgi:hypothetical protein
MTSLHGTFEYFDYESWQRVRCVQKHADKFSYPPNTLMAYLNQHYPRFAQIVVQAKYDARFADIQGRFTIFVSPEWESKSAAEVAQIPVHECKLIVMTNTMEGRLRREDLMTSQSSQLFPLDVSAIIRVWIEDGQLWKDGDAIVSQQVLSNGILQFLKPTPNNRCKATNYLP